MKTASTRKLQVVALAIGAFVIIAAAYVVMARAGAFRLDRNDLVTRYADSASRFVEVSGIDVHYKDEGQGSPVLLLHGSFGSLRTWDQVVAELKDDYRLIRLDQPGSALSGDVPESAEGLMLEDFIRLFLDTIDVDRTTLVGTSSGGLIAYRFAAKYPDRAVALVIANSPSAVVDNSAIDTPPSLQAMSFLSARILKHRPRLYWRLFLESLYGDPNRLSMAIVEQYFNMGRRPSSLRPGSSMYARVNDNDEIDAVLQSVVAPTLLLWGLLDPVLPEPMAYQLQTKLSSAETELVFLNETGHYPPVESPALVAEQIRRFSLSLRDAAP